MKYQQSKNKYIGLVVIAAFIALASFFAGNKFTKKANGQIDNKSENVTVENNVTDNKIGNNEIEAVIRKNIDENTQISLNIAAKLIGAQMEDYTKELCVTNGIAREDDKRGLDVYSDELFKERKITNTEHNNIDDIRKLRNRAAHSNKSTFSQSELSDALEFLKTFGNKYQLSK